MLHFKFELNFPHGVLFLPDFLPSPPPCGWSTGFIATPLTDGLLFNHLDWPALFSLDKKISPLETIPIVAEVLPCIN